MINVTATEYCEAGCLPNCEETVYDYSTSITEIDFEDICDDKTETKKVMITINIRLADYMYPTNIRWHLTYSSPLTV